MEYWERYEEWLLKLQNDPESRRELLAMAEDEELLEEAFYKELEFGTAGLRGKMGLGSCRINSYTLGRATQGLADYINQQGRDYAERGVAIAFDCRRNSREFAREAAQILAANGVKVYIFDSMRPTPELSFTIRELGTASGIN
ncbi:MAG: phospho-sugar mutase, partial [Oscillospiraceae bacterium]|nr:phospho-sugar mutase [Oscillospiraceae bacterium]